MLNAECIMLNEVTMETNVIVEKSLDFAVRIVNLYKFLRREHHEYVMSKQILRSGTSIGANVSEAERGQSRADFTAKMNIALKEANETQYWLKLLYRTDFISRSQYDSLYKDVDELLKILTAICKSSVQGK